MCGASNNVFDVSQWEGTAVGLLDLDAFFASVEQLDNPSLRGKPVIVGGSPEHRGVVSTASYEARSFGVRSAMPSIQAKRLCPQAIWLPGNFVRYKEMSDRVMSILVDETPFVEQVSIDEAFFDVSPGRYSKESPIAICRRIQHRVAELGITCSIGLSTSKTVSKIASEQEKPRGLTIVAPGTEAVFLAPLPVRALSGIGSSTERVLASRGIHTLGELARQNPDEMERLLGISGPRLVKRAAGNEHAPVAHVVEKRAPKSVSNERTFSRDLTTIEEVYAAIGHVSEMVGMRLRRKGLKGSLVTLKIKYDYSHTHSAQQRLDHATSNDREVARIAKQLLEGIWTPGKGVRLVGVGVSGFDSRPEQTSLFNDGTTDEQDERLERVTDQLRQRFGKKAVSYGRDWRLPSSSRNRD